MEKQFVDFVDEKEPDLKEASKRKKGFNKISRLLTNKYLIAMAGFLAVMLFLDKNDLFTTIERKKELNHLNQSKEHYLQELSELKKIKTDLETDPAVIEKLAREKYLMKRENEDVFVTENKTNPHLISQQ